MREESHDENLPMYCCTLDSLYIASDANTVTYKHFDSGTVKLQRGEACELTDAEREACAKLRIERSPPSSLSLTQGGTVAESIANLKKHKRASSSETYINAEFVFGSVAEVE